MPLTLQQKTRWNEAKQRELILQILDILVDQLSLNEKNTLIPSLQLN